MPKEFKPEYVSKAGLRARGWTDKGIELILGKHDKEGVNPYYKKAAPTKLFLLSRVDKAEASDEFKTFQEKNKPKREAAKRSVKAKSDALMLEVKSVRIGVRKIDDNQLLKNAIRSYNEFKGGVALERGDFDYEPAHLGSSRDFLKRITVNYVRHNLTGYDQNIDLLFGRVGRGEAYRFLNERIYDAIGKTYPRLKGECERQMKYKFADPMEQCFGF